MEQQVGQRVAVGPRERAHQVLELVRAPADGSGGKLVQIVGRNESVSELLEKQLEEAADDGDVNVAQRRETVALQTGEELLLR
jgi:16S rRNA G1207 methylase RsmC